ncbi:MAG: hypothetical protein QMD77_01895 [Patescibacteria group bacterium]|nr:hypothetical protein [Patescibacteria group bacterium]
MKKKRKYSSNKSIPKVRPSERGRAKKKKYFFGVGSKWIFRLAAFFVIFYLIAGIVAGPELLRSDLKEKYGRVLGVVSVSVLVRGMPVKPVVAAAPGCDDAYPYVDLDWGDDLGVDTFDVWRDGEILIAGLSSSSYRDSNVNLATTYSYYVIATGPLGTEQSDDVLALSETECYIPPPPSPPPPPVIIDHVIFDGIDLTNFQCCPKINKTKPVFSGTTNVPRARVAVGIQSGKRSIISTFSANRNGYWSWKSRNKLSKGLKTFYLTIADPDDASRVASTSFQFRIAKRKTNKKTLTKCMGGTVLEDITAEIHPFFVNHLTKLAIENQNRTVYAGERLGFSLSRFQEDYPQLSTVPNKLEILDHQGKPVYEESRKLNAQSGGENLGIDEKIAPGKYKLAANYFGKDLDVSAEDDFEVKEKPVLVLGSGYEITYRQIISNLGWVALVSLGLTGIFLFLLLFEYHLSKGALFQVTESDLEGRGMID